MIILLGLDLILSVSKGTARLSKVGSLSITAFKYKSRFKKRTSADYTFIVLLVDLILSVSWLAIEVRGVRVYYYYLLVWPKNPTGIWEPYEVFKLPSAN